MLRPGGPGSRGSGGPGPNRNVSIALAGASSLDPRVPDAEWFGYAFQCVREQCGWRFKKWRSMCPNCTIFNTIVAVVAVETQIIDGPCATTMQGDPATQSNAVTSGAAGASQETVAQTPATSGSGRSTEHLKAFQFQKKSQTIESSKSPTIETQAATQSNGNVVIEPRSKRAREIRAIHHPRLSTGFPELDHFFGGGGPLEGCLAMVAAPPGAGKCLGKGTPVMLHTGEIIPVELVSVGDLLMGPDSRPRTVLSVNHDRGPLFLITPVKGEPWICNDAHVMTLTGTRDQAGQTIDIPLHEHIANCEEKRCKLDRDWKLLRARVSFQRRSIDIDPYLLGIWIGDGHLASPRITNREPEILSYCQQIAKKHGVTVTVTELPKQNTRNIAFRGLSQEHGANPLRVFFSERCVLDGGKHIPSEYIYNDETTRLKLLAGILDTDGMLTHTGSTYILSTVSQHLCNQYLFLARSLGFAAYAKKHVSTIKSIGFSGIYWYICISGDVDRIPCKVARRKANPRRQIKRVNVTGFIVTPIGDGDFYGFQLDVDGRFLLGDFTVTHNSTLLTEVLAAMTSIHGENGLYAAGEEGETDVTLRAREGSGEIEGGVFARWPGSLDRFRVHECTSPEEVIEEIDRHDCRFVVVDSAGSSESDETSSGDNAQITHAAKIYFQRAQARGRHAGKRKCVIFLIMHCTKDGDLAGPNKAVHEASFGVMIEHVDPVTLHPVDELSSTIRLRVYKKSRGSSNKRKCYFDWEDNGRLIPRPLDADGNAMPSLVVQKKPPEKDKKQTDMQPSVPDLNLPATPKRVPPEPSEPPLDSSEATG